MKVLTVKKREKVKGASFWKVCVVIETETEEDSAMIYADVAPYHKVLAEVNRPGIGTAKELVRITNETCFRDTKFPGVYMFHDYFVNCPSVQAILGELEGIRDGVITPNLRHTQGSHILSLLRALDKLWD